VGAAQDSDLTGAHLRALTATYKDIYRLNNKVFPEDPYDQLYEAVFAVFDSWESPRAIKYREAEGITGLLAAALRAPSYKHQKSVTVVTPQLPSLSLPNKIDRLQAFSRHTEDLA
jgi:hypothetical protein